MASKITPAKPFVLMVYGLPGSGKTYFSRQISEKVQMAHLQADKIRADLFENPRGDKQEDEVVIQLMNYMTTEFLQAGLSVAYDANLLRAAQRRSLRELAKSAGAQAVLVWFQLDPDTAFERTQKRDRRRPDDRHALRLTDQAFDGLMATMQNPTAGEDYIVVSGKHLFNTQLATVSRRLRELHLMSFEESGQASSRAAKPQLVNLIPNPAAGRVDLKRRNIRVR